MSSQSLLVIAASVLVMAALWLFFGRSIYGKALRATAVNRVGARLVGIRTELAGSLSLLLAAFIGALSGILISPITTIYYDTGFLIGLKGFVGAILGCMPSGQQVSAGIAAYPPAVITTKSGGSPWLAFIVGLALVALVALFLGAITLRLSGPYLPISTIAWGIAIYFMFGNLELFGKYTGVPDVPPLASPIATYYIIWAATLTLLVACANLLDSRAGRAIRALRFRGVMAESFGVDVLRLKNVVFLYAALFAGLSGWFYAHYLRFVSPSAFNVNAGIDYLFMAVIGGASHVWGGGVGASVLVVPKEEL